MTERKKIIFQSKLICRCFWNKCQWAWKRERAREITWSPAPQRSGLIDLLFSPTLLWEKGKRAKQQPIRSCRGSWQRILQWRTILTKGAPCSRTMQKLWQPSKAEILLQRRAERARSASLEWGSVSAALCGLFFFSLSVWKLSWAVQCFISSSLPHIQSDD